MTAACAPGWSMPGFAASISLADAARSAISPRSTCEGPCLAEGKQVHPHLCAGLRPRLRCRRDSGFRSRLPFSVEAAVFGLTLPLLGRDCRLQPTPRIPADTPDSGRDLGLRSRPRIPFETAAFSGDLALQPILLPPFDNLAAGREPGDRSRTWPSVENLAAGWESGAARRESARRSRPQPSSGGYRFWPRFRLPRALPLLGLPQSVYDFSCVSPPTLAALAGACYKHAVLDALQRARHGVSARPWLQEDCLFL